LNDLFAKFQLKQQLESYGLNPDEWRYEHFEFNAKSKTGTARLSHRDDPNLALKGRIAQDKLRLRSLVKFRWDQLQWDL
jgi:hypothetical protein